MTIRELANVVDPGTEFTVIDNDGILALRNPGELWALNELVIKSVTALDTRHLLIMVD